MLRINLLDNNINAKYDGQCTYLRTQLDALSPFADRKISQLCAENDNLLIFPHSIGDCDDKIGDQTIISFADTADKDKVRLTTGNVMGFIGVGDLQVKIKSRFDEGRDDYLLHYMLERVFSMNLVEMNHSKDEEEIFDFIMFMFPYFLKNAMRQGLYREYQRFQYNDANIKGAVDVSRHIRYNNPFVGNIAYSTREYSYDNSMTELIRHTIEFMRSRKFGRYILSMDSETNDDVGIICDCTPGYSPGRRAMVIQKNLRPSAHPYYTDYRPLQRLCLQILRMEEVKYGVDDEEICGILFDGAWLWEEYVNTVIRDCGFTHPENKKRKNRLCLFYNEGADGKLVYSGPRYPDFYKKDFVLDAKYKRLGSYAHVADVDGEDVHQVITYMYMLQAHRGGFVSPLKHKQTRVPSSSIVGYGGTMSIYGIEICSDAGSYGEFCERMAENEKEFVESLNLN